VSINVIDCEEFRDFVLFRREDVSDGDFSHRIALMDLFFEQYGDVYAPLVAELKVFYFILVSLHT
jgi:hypothetical protein